MKSVVGYLKQKSGEESSQGQLAKFILEYEGDVTKLKVREITDLAYVSTPTAVRLAQSGGYAGYNEFKFELKRELESINKQDMQYSNIVIDNYINNYVNALVSTSHAFDYSLIQELAIDISRSSEVVLFGIGSTMLRAMDFEYKLRRMGIRTMTSLDFDQQKALSKTVGKNSTVIAISYSGEKEQVNECIENSLVCCGSVFLISTVNKFGDAVKHIKLEESEPLARNFSISSVASISFVLDLVFLELLKCDPNKYRGNLSSTKQ